MRGGFYKAVAAIGLTTLSGCVQMTRHSNMMIFGTNTAVGLHVGVNAASVPEIALGYSRQEAVVLPLVANTGVADAGPTNNNRLIPCDPTRPVAATDAHFAVHPCSLVGLNGSALDSYSVLASFGAKFNAKGSTTNPEAEGGLAQYFSTGIAAQLLALTGGASVVAVGDAATAKAGNPVSDGAVKSLFGNEKSFEIGTVAAAAYAPFNAKLATLVTALGSDAEVPIKISKLVTDAGLDPAANPGKVMPTKCTSKTACLAAIAENDFGQIYNRNQTAFDKAILKW